MISGSGSARISQNISAGKPRCTMTREGELDVTSGGAVYYCFVVKIVNLIQIIFKSLIKG